jgi:hypothetical protein
VIHILNYIIRKEKIIDKTMKRIFLMDLIHLVLKTGPTVWRKWG